MSALTKERPVRRPSQIGHVETMSANTDVLTQIILRYKAQNGDRWEVDVPATNLTGLTYLLKEPYLTMLSGMCSQNTSTELELLTAAIIMAEAGYVTIEGEGDVEQIHTTAAFERLCGA